MRAVWATHPPKAEHRVNQSACHGWGAGFFVCKLKKVSNTKREEGQGEEAESDEDEAPPLEDWDADEVAEERAARAAAKGVKAITASVETKRKVKKRSFNLEQSGACLVTHSLCPKLFCHGHLCLPPDSASAQYIFPSGKAVHIHPCCSSK